MSEPSSFCTICTKKCIHELKSLLSSISLYHNLATVYIICDNPSREALETTFSKSLNCIWYVELDKYSNLSRSEMTRMNIWSYFQMYKATAIEYSLKHSPDTLFVDSDVIFLGPVNCIDDTKDLGVSIGYINQETIDKVGYYNGGFIWTKNTTMPNRWRHYTKTSRYFDQASIEDLVKEYTTFIFPEQYNFQPWRFIVGEESSNQIESHFNVINNTILYKEQPLQSIHTHFDDQRFYSINQFLIRLILRARMKDIFLIIGNNIRHKN